MRHTVVVLLASLTATVAPYPADCQTEAAVGSDARRPYTVLVLSGGGARGMAHIGVLEVLEQHQVPFDAIVGTSMGAVVGGLYASGVSPGEMRTQLEQIDWIDAFDDEPPRRVRPFRRKEDDNIPLFKLELGFNERGFQSPSGLIAGQKLNFYLRAMLLRSAAVDSFDELPVPFRAIATDLDTGEMAVLDRGDLPKAIRASMAFPVMFTPVEYDGRLLIDGGVVRNLAVDVALEMGAEVVIAVDVGSTIDSLKTESPSAFNVLRRTQSIQSKEGRGEQLRLLREQDLLIGPQLDGIVTFADFEKIDEAVACGRAAAQEQEQRLRELADPDEFERFLARQRSGASPGAIPIEAIEVRGVERVPRTRILRRILSRPGQPLDLATLQEDLKRVYLIGEFETVEFHLERLGSEGYQLVIDAREKSWGPWYLRGGLGLESNFDGVGSFRANALLRRAEVNRLGAEWRTLLSIGDVEMVETDLYQPLSQAGTWFVDPSLLYVADGEETLNVDGTAIVLDTLRGEIELDLGVALGQWGQLRVGALTGRSHNSAIVAGVEDLDERLGAVRLRFPLDTLDNAYFPRHGTQFILDQRISRQGLGADRDYERLLFEGVTAGSFGPNTLLGKLRIGTDYDSDLPFYDDFRLGGFLDMSGLTRGQLLGNELGFLALVYYRKLNRSPGAFGMNYYLGASLEAGSVWEQQQAVTLSDLEPAGSIFVGAETLFGPIYLAYGQTSGTRGTFYFFLGRLF
ncbi:MAG TPA: patatin-like phospholipase family protein [Candidatus Polarisedimenticolaceae bacterium]|nr:patatin-like phospholipase family protein [Candidatus Polarisedimenticolaceae bacterium]